MTAWSLNEGPASWPRGSAWERAIEPGGWYRPGDACRRRARTGRSRGRVTLMAVYQGTRTPAPALPMGVRRVAARRSARIPARAHRGLRSIGITLAMIIVAFLLGLVYLTQTLQSAVTRHEIDSVLIDRNALEQELQSQIGAVAQADSEEVIIHWGDRQAPGPAGHKSPRTGSLVNHARPDGPPPPHGRAAGLVRRLCRRRGPATRLLAGGARRRAPDPGHRARWCARPRSRRSGAPSTTATAPCWRRRPSGTRSPSTPPSWPRAIASRWSDLLAPILHLGAADQKALATNLDARGPVPGRVARADRRPEPAGQGRAGSTSGRSRGAAR